MVGIRPIVGLLTSVIIEYVRTLKMQGTGELNNKLVTSDYYRNPVVNLKIPIFCMKFQLIQFPVWDQYL